VLEAPAGIGAVQRALICKRLRWQQGRSHPVYLPSHFVEDRPEVLGAFIEAHPFGMLVTLDGGHPTIDLMPMLLDREAPGGPRLRGHVARANPVARRVPSGAEVLAVFGGVQHYISPSWYPSMDVDDRVVPTWNYVAIEVRGRIDWFDEPQRLRGLVGALTDRHESGRSEPWSVADAPPDYIDSMLRAIVGFEIAVASLTGKFKGSQNRSAADRDGVARGLAADGVSAASIAELVREPRR
jgi:transcriptional regulator